MKPLILMLAFSIANIAFAENKPVSNSYKCNSEGCSITCLTDSNKWSALATGASKVAVNHYENGNVEFMLMRGTNENTARSGELIMISNDNLQCKLTGIVIE